jgi:AraC-like DNA-binding protein
MAGVRVAKSTVYIYTDNLPDWIINIGFGAHALIAPLLLLYLLSIQANREWKTAFLLHYIPGLSIIILSPFLIANEFWYKGGYGFLLYYTLIYLIASWWVYVKTTNKSSSMLILMIGLSLFQLSYFSNYILRLTPYEAAPVIHSVIIYAISFIILKSQGAFAELKSKKYRNLNIQEEELIHYRQKIISVMNSQRPYLETDFSLAKLSSLTGIQTHLLSYVFNEFIKQNFQLFTNTHRVNDARQLLMDPSKKHLSIAAIANECGFNTLSSFNKAFKDITGQTPSEFKNKRN